jgi:hypothetical protein
LSQFDNVEDNDAPLAKEISDAGPGLPVWRRIAKRAEQNRLSFCLSPAVAAALGGQAAMSNRVHCLVVSPRSANSRADARSASLLMEAHTLGLSRLGGLECHDLYFVEGQARAPDRERLASEP